jgi:pimeloyl-ACP methyl ester carboxylesterase
MARLRVMGVLCVLGLLAAFVWLQPRLIAAGLLLRMEGGKVGPAWLAGYGAHPVDELPFALPSGAPGVLYTPRGVRGAPGLVLAHGIHEQGAREPRMVAFARALAASGLSVLTPELSALAHYRVTHADARLIAEAARTLARELETEQVGVFGVSFGGGLALRAACEPGLRAAIGRVITLGAHHDAAVVSRFFLGEPAHTPDGRTLALKPHGYGGTVLFASLFGEQHKGPIRASEKERLAQALKAHGAELAAASPAHCPEPPFVPLYMVHGLGDRIIPYSETLWNAHQFASSTDVTVLISPAIGHADYGPPSFWQRAQLVNFMAAALR